MSEVWMFAAGKVNTDSVENVLLLILKENVSNRSSERASYPDDLGELIGY
jgi:hypothetical protein